MRYKAYAHFYKNAQGESCRKYLDVKSEHCISPQPELILLMLNPGSCGNNERIELNKDVEVKRDPTFYRVQAFMKRHNLNWVRVLSLSDLQEKSSQLFFKKLGPLEGGYVPEHSIFHPSRLAELSSNASPETPFLLAWGDDKRKAPLANTAIRRLKEKGYPIINESGLHVHPLARAVNGIPPWREYADEVYRSYLASKQEVRLSSTPAEEDKLAAAFKLFNNFEIGHPIITGADTRRRERFATLVRDAGLRPFLGTGTYDYVYIDRVGNAADLYDLLQQHNGKRMIIDAVTSPNILKMKGGIELLEGAVCHNPETGDRWQVGQGYSVPGKQPFTFNGKIALLTELSIEQLKANNRFQYLLRDCVVV
jgi:hypothetical protein